MADRTAFKASADVRLADPQAMLHGLCDYFAEFGRVSIDGGTGTIETDFGRARLAADGPSLSLGAESSDETGLAFVKLSLAEHLVRLAGPHRPSIVWQGHGAAGSPLPYFREMTVTRTQDVTSRLRRITLSGSDLARFATGGLHVRLLFPQDTSRPAWPVTGADGRPEWPTGAARPQVRIYTIRRIDVASGEMDIDFVLHDGACPGGDFARTARPGQRVGMTGPGGGDTPAADWLLLCGDETALPAIARMVEDLPPTASAVVRLEVRDRTQEIGLTSRAALDVKWLHRGDAAPGTTALLNDALRAVEIPEGPGRFVWAGCEHAAARSIRSWLRSERGLARDEHLCVAYWRRGRRGDDAREGED